MKGKTRFHRQILTALTVIWLAGQSIVPVLAQENTVPVEAGIMVSNAESPQSGNNPEDSVQTPVGTEDASANGTTDASADDTADVTVNRTIDEITLENEMGTDSTFRVKIYAVTAAAAGAAYLLLGFIEKSRGMTAREKEVFVAAFLRWARKGGRFRKCCAMAAIFFLLAYYHSIGKHTVKNRRKIVR